MKRTKVPKGVAEAIRQLADLRIKRKAIKAEEDVAKLLVKEFMLKRGLEYLPVGGARATIDIQVRRKWDFGAIADTMDCSVETLEEGFSTTFDVARLTCEEEE